MSILWVRAVCEIQLTSYDNKYALQSLSKWHFVHTYSCNLLTTGRTWNSTYWMTALLSEMSIFWVRVACEIQLANYMYGSNHTSQFLSDRPFACTYMHNLKLQVIYECSAYQTTALLLEKFLVWFRVTQEIRLESYSPRQTSRLFYETTLSCIYMYC